MRGLNKLTQLPVTQDVALDHNDQPGHAFRRAAGPLKGARKNLDSESDIKDMTIAQLRRELSWAGGNFTDLKKTVAVLESDVKMLQQRRSLESGTWLALFGFNLFSCLPFGGHD